MTDQKRRGSLLQFLLIFTLVYFGSQLIINRFFPNQANDVRGPGVYLSVQDKTIRNGNDIFLEIENATTTTLTLPDRCPMPPVDVYSSETTTEGAVVYRPLATNDTAVECTSLRDIPAGETLSYSLAPWKYSLFGKNDKYQLRLPSEDADILKKPAASGALTGSGTPTVEVVKIRPTVEIEVYEPGVLAKLFRTFITKPFLNFLVFAASWLPNHNLGFAIILLTLIVKLLLFYPTQKALQGQKEMQKLQPKLEALKKQYPNDPQKLQEETMKLWKEHNVNPMQSCLPTLVQFPVLIGLFYVIRDGSHLELSQHLLYPMYQQLDWTFGTNFLGLNLLEPSWFIMPPLLVVLQFLQMKLAFAISDRKKAKSDIIDVPSAKEIQKEIKEASTDPVSAQKLQQNMMLYGLPIIIGVMAFQFPAAVSVYWGISTLFGIAQQLIVNRKSL
jgi:YidC/Oxa1 family membrane protein insertase